ncbi:N-formylglutamate amidohydrolase [uncultured Pontibacter sp.]|uniref:N-formylglutamate amidohydrolase n=1 Tax=uncultured Pontibacter sp. TaxID=453356 RepID=UPI00261FA8E0|nr:N-formylglutamate amidohydrolase [uncultured Pontibacter sp.]
MLRLLLTCEHGGNLIPPAYAPLFHGHEDVLETHRGYDIGALELFNSIKPVADVSFYAETSRLLVELNRSANHAKLFSEFSNELPKSEKDRLLERHYKPYREQVEQMVQDFVSAGRRLLHIAVHTFTPVLEGEERKADIGLLYDPKRPHEQAYSKQWKAALNRADKDLVVRFNYPYLGISDGFPTYLRRKFTANEYVGIELEVNQRFPLDGGEKWQKLQALLAGTLQELVIRNRAELSGDSR